MGIKQLAFKKNQKKQRRSKTPVLEGAPQVRGVVYKVDIMSPRKPNSAKRKVAKIRLVKIPRKAWARINGVGMPKIAKFSIVLVEGGNSKDLPGVNYRMVWGKYDFHMILEAQVKRKRSKFSLNTLALEEHKKKIKERVQNNLNIINTAKELSGISTKDLGIL